MYWLFIALAIVAMVYVILFLLAINLLDVKLILSLLVLELPLAIGLSYMLGERKRSKVQEAIEKVRSAKDLAHLRIHRFGNPLMITWYYVENIPKKSAYDAPQYFLTLAEHDLVDIVDHKTKEDMVEHFKSSGITFEDKHPKPSQLT